MRTFFLACCVFLLFMPGRAWAQEVPLATDFDPPGVTGYDSAIPTPQDVIGHRIGEAHTTPAQVYDYFRVVDAASDRLVVEQHGRTYEGRPLIHAVVTSPANHARLDAIRQANHRLSDAPDAVTDAEIAAMPAILYLGYSVHGNEASGTEAAVLLLYHLAAGQGPAVDEALNDLVILLDPLFNPDGRDRFADWANRNRGGVPNADPQDREHQEAWPGGRTNHYWFDLNRDWLPVQHPESQARIALFHHWRPQLLTDHHEMGSNNTFFFQPGVPSRTNPNTLPENQALTAEIATFHAAALDRIGQLYYSAESFDDFYYGKGSTYPDVNGAIGILFEQASSRALLRETVRGELDYATTARNQFATSLSTIEAAVALREKLLRLQQNFYREAARMAQSNPIKGYVIDLERGRTRAQELGHILRQHRIRVHELARDVQADGKTFRAGAAYLVPMNQPQAKLVKAVMEEVTTFTDSLFYDVSAWTLPHAFDVDAAALRGDVGALAGPELTRIAHDGGALVGGRSDYAYVIERNRYFVPRALYRLQAAGIRPALMKADFSARVGGQVRDFSRGSIIVPVDQQDAEANTVQRMIDQIVDQDHVRAYAIESGLTPGGPDLGSPSTTILERPKVALVTGSGTSAYNAGEVWHLLSERFRIPVSLLDTDRLAGLDLSRYNTLVMAGGSYGSVPADKLKEWVRGGGRLIALASAAEWAIEHEFFELEERPFDLDSLVQEVPFADLGQARGAQVVGGSIFEARLDQSHPLAYGMEATMPVFVRNRRKVFSPASAPGTTVAVLTDDPLLSGYLSEEQGERLAGSATLVAARMGRGRVILFMDNPNFRAFWYGTNGLFLNAVFFGGAF